MKHFFELLDKNVDFHFSLALIAILGTAASLYLQFNEANNEFNILNASMYSVVRSYGIDSKENMYLNQELNKLAKSLDDLKF
jgi:hypothetical protein